MSSKTTEPARQKGTIISDPETVAINKCAGLLGGLDPDCRRRVLIYLNSRFAPLPPAELPERGE